MVKILLKLSKILDMMSAQLRFVAMELKERPDTQLWVFFSPPSHFSCSDARIVSVDRWI